MERLRNLLLAALLAAGAGLLVPHPAVAANALPDSRFGLFGRGETPAVVGAVVLEHRFAPANRLAIPPQSVRLAMAPVRNDGQTPAIDRTAGFLGQLTSPEKRLFADAADGQLDDHSLLDAALVASGVEDQAELDRYVEFFGALASELKQTEKLYGSPRQQAEAVFEFLHRRILHRGYRLEGTDLRTAIEEGRFNCVSATVLYNCLAASCGLSTCGLESPGHAMSRVLLPEGAIDVETTCPRWFKLMGDPKRQAEHVAKTLGRSPSRDDSQTREVSTIQLAAMIYYNRGVDLLGARKFAEAAAANAKALRLDPSSKTARGNLLATINNWAIAEGASRHYAAALDLIRQGMAIDPNFEVFRLNYSHVCRQWALDLCATERHGEAVDVLRDALQVGPDPAPLRAAIADAYRQWAQSLGRGSPSADAMEVLQEAKAELGPMPELIAAEAAELSRLAGLAAQSPLLEVRSSGDFESGPQEQAIFERPRRGSRRDAVSRDETEPRAAPD